MTRQPFYNIVVVSAVIDSRKVLVVVLACVNTAYLAGCTALDNVYLALSLSRTSTLRAEQCRGKSLTCLSIFAKKQTHILVHRPIPYFDQTLSFICEV